MGIMLETEIYLYENHINSTSIQSFLFSGPPIITPGPHIDYAPKLTQALSLDNHLTITHHWIEIQNIMPSKTINFKVIDEGIMMVQ